MQGLFLTPPNLSVSGGISKHNRVCKCWASDVSRLLRIWEFCSLSSCFVMRAHTQKKHLRSSRPVWWGWKWMTGAKETGQSLELKLQKTHTCSFIQTRTQIIRSLKYIHTQYICTLKNEICVNEIIYSVKPLRCA